MEKDLVQGANLDGMTILRFTHAFDSGGGVELYLHDLNRTLLRRHDMTIIQIHFSRGLLQPKETVMEMGRGRLVSVAIPPVISPHQEWNGTAPQTSTLVKKTRNMARDFLLYNPLLERLFLPVRKKLGVKALGIEAHDAVRMFKDFHRRYSIDLLSLHCLGGADTAKLIEVATQEGIPYLYLNHYANEKFTHLCIREQLQAASGVAGVSARGVPKYLKDRYVSLYDGVDTTFYSPVQASAPCENPPQDPVVLLPARICVGKGHWDLIRAASLLQKEGVALHLVFAGRNDSPEISAQLQAHIDEHDLTNRVTIVGQCTTEKLRDWYNYSSVVALPSRSEGFARVLLEAQAMETPVVAYNVGGVSQTFVHGESGYLCRYKDIKDLKTVLKKLLRSESLRRGMGKAGRRFMLNNYTVEHLTSRHEEFYSSIVKKSGVPIIKKIRETEKKVDVY